MQKEILHSMFKKQGELTEYEKVCGSKASHTIEKQDSTM